MRGSVRRRASGSWALIVERGYERDAATGTRKRIQKWYTFHNTPGLTPVEERREAETKLAELVTDQKRGVFAEPTKVTLIEWLRTWLERSALVSDWRPATVRLYTNVIEKHLAKSSIAHRPVQQIRASHLEHYLASLRCAPATVGAHHAVLHGSLRKAVRTGC